MLSKVRRKVANRSRLFNYSRVKDWEEKENPISDSLTFPITAEPDISEAAAPSLGNGKRWFLQEKNPFRYKRWEAKFSLKEEEKISVKLCKFTKKSTHEIIITQR